MMWPRRTSDGSRNTTDRASVLVLQLLVNLLLGYAAGLSNHVRNAYFAVMWAPIVLPAIFTAIFLYSSNRVTRVAGAVLCVITTIALVFFVLVVAPVWFRFMV